MNYSTKFKYFFIFQLLAFVAFSCKQQSEKTETVQAENKTAFRKAEAMDSTFIINYARSVPEFKEHEKLLRTFYRDRAFRLAWFKNDELIPQAEKFKEVI